MRVLDTIELNADDDKRHCVVVAGMARSGTACVAALAGKFGLDARHQDLPGPRDEELYPYDLDNPPPHAASRARHFAWAAPEFNASWGLSFYLKLMQDERRHLRILIAVRDPLLVCNSLWNYRQRVEGRKPNPLRYFVRQYIECYEFMIAQAERMNPRPEYYDAEDMFKGVYNESLLGVFRVHPGPGAVAVVEQHLAERTNHHGSYRLEWCEEMIAARHVAERLKIACPELPRRKS